MYHIIIVIILHIVLLKSKRKLEKRLRTIELYEREQNGKRRNKGHLTQQIRVNIYLITEYYITNILILYYRIIL